jgi:hypothetical protein
MNTKIKKKLCWNCEGNVLQQDSLCPYCGVSLEVSPIPGTDGKDPFLPPYRLMSGSAQEQNIPIAPYTPEQGEEVEENTRSSERQEPSQDIASIAIPLSALLLGSVFVLFSFILFIFSDAHGVLTLNWNGTYWFLYLLLGLPLLYFGWKISK